MARGRKHKSARVRNMQFAVEYGLLRGLEQFFRLLGPDIASAVSGKLWRWFAPLNHRHKAALRHLAVAFPELEETQRLKIAGDVWENLGRTFAEALMIDRVMADPSRIEMPTTGLIEDMRESGGRFVVTSLHCANWEIAAAAFTRDGFAVGGIYQKVNNPLVDRWIVGVRTPYYPGGLFVKGQAAARRLLAWGKSGNPPGVLADQRIGDGIMVPFFGHPAPSTPLPAFLAMSLDYPLIGIRVVRLQGCRFRVEIERIPVADTGDRATDIATTTATVQATFERWIREYPGQWMWAHRRWTLKGPPLSLLQK